VALAAEPIPAGLAVQAAGVAEGAWSSTDLVGGALAAIRERDPGLGAFVAVLEGEALAEAATRDRDRARGRLRGPLHGVPVAVKDLFDVAGAVTAAGSPKLAANTAWDDAVAVARLRAAGAVIVGKTRTHEFAYGVQTPGTANPWDRARIPGGSSGGSAVAVAAGLVPAALGTDTAGSIRIPAACCGVVGLKPTYGRVPAEGVWPLSWSCDHVGPIARDAADTALAFAALTGRPVDPVPRRGPLRLGWLAGEEIEWIHPGVAAALADLRTRLTGAGAVIDEVGLPLAAARAAVAALVLPEAAAAHERLLDDPAGYGPGMLSALRVGQSALAVEYLRGLRYRGRFTAAVEDLLAGRDALVLPTIPVPAPAATDTEVEIGGERRSVQAALTALPGAFNCSGSPVVSLPCGLADGLPVGVSLVGRLHADAELLETALAVEAAAPRIGLPAA
jgi:aspartyl-tRNA(Asn)/glutamyl-tRNA(Gln) amidotransferase subunit A